jgi:hypothetical protein
VVADSHSLLGDYSFDERRSGSPPTGLISFSRRRRKYR